LGAAPAGAIESGPEGSAISLRNTVEFTRKSHASSAIVIEIIRRHLNVFEADPRKILGE